MTIASWFLGCEPGLAQQELVEDHRSREGRNSLDRFVQKVIVRAAMYEFTSMHVH